MRTHRRGQALVEFGVIALLFTALMFAVVDFGLVLNSWLTVSSGSREIARNASVGKKSDFLVAEAQKLNILSVSASGFSGGLCCGTTSAIEVRVEYFDQSCKPWTTGCNPVPPGVVDQNYPAGTLGTTGGCTSSCAHPKSDDLVRVSVIAHGAQVITPLIRTAVGCTNGSNPNCYFPVKTVTIMRYEGAEF